MNPADHSILVTGGTGLLGGAVVNLLSGKGTTVSVLTSKSNRTLSPPVIMRTGNLVTGEGLPEAVDGAGTIIHCASDPRNFQAVDVEGTRHLLNAIGKQPEIHLIYISIVGVDRSDYPYYKAKYEVEKMIAASGCGFTILRSTQFHEFVLAMINGCTIEKKMLKVPSGMRFQSVDLSEVAGRLAMLSQTLPLGSTEDFGGPEVLAFDEMVEAWLDITDAQLQTEATPVAGIRYELFRSGVNLCEAKRNGKINWRSWLERTC